MLFGCIVCAQWGVAAAADTGDRDVTITVVTDPDQLTEKVNTIRLPEVSDGAAESSSGNGKQSGHAEPKDNTADKAKSDAESPNHDRGAVGGERREGPPEESKQDAHGEQQDHNSGDGATSG